MNNKCPSTDSTYKPQDVFEIPCPECSVNVELFGDDRRGRCAACGHSFPNPRLQPSGD